MKTIAFALALALFACGPYVCQHLVIELEDAPDGNTRVTLSCDGATVFSAEGALEQAMGTSE
jgi:hypothetical protein